MGKLKEECNNCSEYNRLDCGGEYEQENTIHTEPSCYRYRDCNAWKMLQKAHYTDVEQKEITNLYRVLKNICATVKKEDLQVLESALQERQSETTVLLQFILGGE